MNEIEIHSSDCVHKAKSWIPKQTNITDKKSLERLKKTINETKQPFIREGQTSIPRM